MVDLADFSFSIRGRLFDVRPTFFYAPNFEKVEGVYCFGLVRPLQKLSYSFEITQIDLS